MAKTDYKTIDEYQNTFPVEIQERMQKIRHAINAIVPEAEETISYQIPCFKYKGYLLYYSAYSKHISLSHPFSKEFLAHFDTTLKNYVVSKSAIQLPNNESLPMGLIREIIKFRMDENIRDEKPKKVK